MIVEFAITNFRSIAGEQVLSLVCDSGGKADIARCAGIDDGSGLMLARSAALYGANASGKSNVLRALMALQSMVLFSRDMKMDEAIPDYDPFALDQQWEKVPTRFSLEFVANDLYETSRLHRYRLTLAYDATAIREETLLVYRTRRPTMIYSRIFGKSVTWGAYLTGSKQGIERLLLDNQMLLSVAANTRDHPLSVIYHYFKTKIISPVSALAMSGTPSTRSVALNHLRGEGAESFISAVGDMLKAIDTGIQGIRIKEQKNIPNIKFFDQFPDEVKKVAVDILKHRPFAMHNRYDGETVVGQEEFPMANESSGTKAFFEIAPVFVEALRDGNIVLLDELGNALHPDITRYIVTLFHNPDINRNNAQLLFSSHDVSLLTPELFRRDQLWFTQKNTRGVTQLYSLLEFKKSEVRKDTDFGTWYLQGRFGALPVIDRAGMEAALRGEATDDARKA